MDTKSPAFSYTSRPIFGKRSQFRKVLHYEPLRGSDAKAINVMLCVAHGSEPHESLLTQSRSEFSECESFLPPLAGGQGRPHQPSVEQPFSQP